MYDHQAWYLKQTYVSNRAEIIRQLLSEQVQWPEDTEILLADMPPSTASEVFSFFEHLTGLLGVIIVSQPSEISALGMRRTVDFLRLKEVPILGIVSMMDGYLCPNCRGVSHQLLSPKLAMEKEARDCGIPFLMSIPQTPDLDTLKPYFAELAQDVLTAKPVILKKESREQRMKRRLTRLGLKVLTKLT
jgi:MinD-like ATPase involved in chromosome partitioning or flagellar assembly